MREWRPVSQKQNNCKSWQSWLTGLRFLLHYEHCGTLTSCFQIFLKYVCVAKCAEFTFDLTKGPIPLALSVLASTCASFKNNSLAPLHKHCRRTAYCPAQISRSKIQSRSGQSQCRNSPIGPVHFTGRELIWVDLCSQLDTCHFCKSRRQCCGDQTEHLTEQVVCSHFTVVWFFAFAVAWVAAWKCSAFPRVI